LPVSNQIGLPEGKTHSQPAHLGGVTGAPVTVSAIADDVGTFLKKIMTHTFNHSCSVAVSRHFVGIVQEQTKPSGVIIMSKRQLLLIIIPFVTLNLFAAVVTSYKYIELTIRGNASLKRLFSRSPMISDEAIYDRTQMTRRWFVPVLFLIANLASAAIILANWNRK
jgi:hypothetical protein